MMRHLTVLILLLASLKSISQHNTDLATNKSNYYAGESIVLNFITDTPLNASSWVGLYNSSASKSTSSGYLTYRYIGDRKTTSLNFDAPDNSGDYEFRVYDAKPEIKVVSTSFTVVNIDPRAINLTILSTKVTPNNNFEVSIESELEFNPKAWLGIFKSDIDLSERRGYTSYKYFSNVKDNIFVMIAPSEPGLYDLRFFSSDPGKLVKRMSFRVGEIELPGLAFTLNKDEYNPEENVIIDYTGHDDLPSNSWFGIYKEGIEPGTIKGFLGYRYVRIKTGGMVIFKAPSQKGNYNVRWFYANNGPMLLEPTKFSVSSSIDKGYLKDAIESDGKVALYGIYFDSDKSIVKTESYGLIEQIAEMLNSDLSLKIRIEGHTDSDGELYYNQNLSEKRSKSISDLLILKYKVSNSQLETQGFGETKPVGDNNTEDGRAKNRRVELVKI